MQTHLVSLLIGLAVGVAYGALNVRSPAPPVVALVGLLGMLCGEQIVTWLRGPHQEPAVRSVASTVRDGAGQGESRAPR